MGTVDPISEVGFLANEFNFYFVNLSTGVIFRYNDNRYRIRNGICEPKFKILVKAIKDIIAGV
jgi:hypothetical protein